MEMTESIVTSVHPDAENDRIQEMAIFGWSLHGRQEIIGPLREAETPDNLATAMLRGGIEGATNSVYVQRDHYVKLHFTRSLGLPNLRRIKEIESECASLPFPGAASLKGPGCFTLFFAMGVFPAVVMMSTKPATGLGMLATYGMFVALGVLWLRSRMAKNRHAAEIRSTSAARAAELVEEARALVQPA